MKSYIAMSVFLTLGLSGCSSQFVHGRDISPYSQVKGLKQGVADNQVEYGHLARGATHGYEHENYPIARPWESATGKAFEFTSLENARICFEVRARDVSAADVAKEADQLRTNYAYVVGTHASLDEWNEASPWPTPTPANSLDSVVPRKSTAAQRHDHGEAHEGTPTIELCGPAPQITDSTNFLSVSAVQANHPENNYVLIWDFKGQRKE